MKAGWNAKRLDELCTVFTDGDWIESKDQSSSGVRLVQTGNIGNGDFKDRSEKARYISEATFDRLRCTELQAGDCLVSRLPDPVGRACLIPALPEKAITAVDCTIIRFEASTILPAFFVYFSQSPAYAGQVARLTGGATRQRISRKNLGQVAIPLPPFEEQRRIVAVLDEAFAAIATAAANAEKNIANTRALFESRLPGAFAPRGEVRTNGALGKIGGQVFTGPFGSVLHKSDYVLGGIPLVNPAHIEAGKIVPSENKTVSVKTADRLSSYRMDVGDIVFGRRGEIGRCAVVGEAEAGWLCGTGSFFIRPFPLVNPHFLAQLLRSPDVRAQLESLAAGATMLNLSNAALAKLPISLPDMDTQNKRLQEIEELERESAKLRAIYRQKYAALTRLKQSLLVKAFSGELHAIDLEAIAA